MNMIVLDLEQGSPEWLAARGKYLTASEAPAMLGFSPYKSRLELIREKATGYTKEIDAATQRRFDDGHKSEAVARPIAEEFLLADLYADTVSREVDGLSLLASLDGRTEDWSIIWENKLAKQSNIAMIDRGDLDDEYWPQVEQQLLVTGAEKCLFTICDGDDVVGKLWYESKPERRAKVIAGWKLFLEDVANYQHVETAPRVTADAIPDLPALAVEVVGTVVSSNLSGWKETVLSRIESINTNLQTDQDFANAEATVKFLDEGEKRIDLVKAQAQSQATDIDLLFKTMDEIKAKMKSTRTTLKKLIDDRKVSIRAEIKAEAETKLAAHITAINRRLERVMLPKIEADFAGAMRAKKTVKSLRDGVDAELTRVKLLADELAGKIQDNLKTLDDNKEHAFLFSDSARLVLKEPDDFKATVSARILQHESDQTKKREEERARIAAEERAKIEREQAEVKRKEEAEAAAKKAAEEAQVKAAADAAAQIEQDRIRGMQNVDARPTTTLGQVLDAVAPAPIAAAFAANQPALAESTAMTGRMRGGIGGGGGHPVAATTSATRPTDDQIIDVLALHYRVHESKVIEWLLKMDLNAASERMVAKEFVA